MEVKDGKKSKAYYSIVDVGGPLLRGSVPTNDQNKQSLHDPPQKF